MTQPELDMFVEFSRLCGDRRELFLWRHPHLLEPGVAERLADRVALDPAAMAMLWDVVGRYNVSDTGFPIGTGPIEEVWRQVGPGQISLEHGRRLVSTPAFTAALSARYLRALAGWTAAGAIRGGWEPSLGMARLIWAAVSAAGDTRVPLGLRAQIAADFTEVAKVALRARPDGALLAETAAILDAVLAQAGDGGGPRTRGLLNFARGTLFVDPYFAGVSSLHFDESLRAWRSRAQTYGDGAAGPQMPEPLAALHTAEQYLRRALALKPLGDRGSTLKSLADVLTWREQFSDNVDRAEIIQVCRDALEDLDVGGDPRLRPALINILQYLGAEVDARESAAILDIPVEALVEDYGPAGAATTVLAAINTVKKSAPRAVVDAIKRFRPLFAQSSEDLQRAVIDAELSALADALVGPIPEQESLQRSVLETNQRADRESWNGPKRAAAMLRLAVRAPQTDEEELGLQLLDQIPQVSPIVAAEHPHLLAWLRTTMHLNLGVNAYNDERWSDCAQEYARALSGFLDLGFDDEALDTLERVWDIVDDADEFLDAPILMALAPNAARIEARLGDKATAVIQEMIRAALATLGRYSTSPEALNFFWQVAKGARLAPVLADIGRYDPAADGYARRMLENIDELRAAVTAETGRSTEAGLAGVESERLVAEEFVLTTYARRRSAEGGRTAAEQLTNLEHAYDEHVSRQMLLAPGTAPAAYLPLEGLQQFLGKRTLLVTLYLGATEDGRLAVYVLCFTDEEVKLSVIPHDFPADPVESGGMQTNPLGVIVEQIRSQIQDPPLGRRVVDRETEVLLDAMLPGLLGHVSTRLEEFRAAGRDHLCIVPHGPLHFLPFHLLGWNGRPLAEDFVVSYLPHLLLLADHTGAVPHAEPMAAVGLGFAADPRPGLSPLPEALREAQEIAEIYGTQAIVGEAATEDAITAAMSTARVVHLATHGRHNVDAPAFHKLYVQPSEGSDGSLHAYELLGLDLRGLRLVTLSACETALGRFDFGDNIRGLPASLFISGVRTLIGTLWPTRDVVCRHFFVTFHRAYADGTPMLDAFAYAQRDTRASYPQYCDWGAFYFAGTWADRTQAEEDDVHDRNA